MRLRILLRLCAGMLVMLVLACMQLSSAGTTYHSAEAAMHDAPNMIAEAQKGVDFWKAKPEGADRDAGLARANDYLIASQGKAQAIRNALVAKKKAYFNWMVLATACGAMALAFFGAWLRVNQVKKQR